MSSNNGIHISRNVVPFEGRKGKPEGALPPGGGGGTSDGMEQRIAALEKGFEKLDGKLDRLIEAVTAGRLENEKRFGAIDSRLTGIEAKLDTKATKTDLAPIEAKLSGLEGRVANIPTTWQTIAIIAAILVGIAGVSFTVAMLTEKAAINQTAAPITPAPGPRPR